MAIVLNDILVEINHADYSFENPVPLITENSSSGPVGYAELERRSDRIYATLHIEDETKPYTEYYLKADMDPGKEKIVSLHFTPNPNEDIRIERIMNQELFQSSAGADNAGLQ